jgi:DNA-directed RNA polymerase subunit RPC12/RpoP
MVHREVSQNRLIQGMERVVGRVAVFKDLAMAYYFDVVLSQYRCIECGRGLRMTDRSECACSCGKHFDPTLAFQKSPCCQAQLVKRTFHYACSRCNAVVPSRFLFDEKVFDASYFREMMRESRKRAKESREAIRRLLAESRSDHLPLMENPDLGSIPGLIQDLDDFIQDNPPEIGQMCFPGESDFAISDYREHILSLLGWDSMLFSDISPLIQDLRADKAWRFITAVFMDHEREIELAQHGNDLVIQRLHNEAYA